MTRLAYTDDTDPEEVIRDLVDAIQDYGRTQADDPAEEERGHVFDVMNAARRYLNDRAAR